MNGWQHYGTRNLQVVPMMPNTPVYTDAMMPYLFERTKAEGKLLFTFCGDEFNLSQFIAFFEKLRTLQILCEVEKNRTLKPCGYSWVSNPHGVDGARSAMIGFCFLNNSSRRSSARDLGRLGLAYMFEDLRIDCLHGILLESNLPGRNYARRLGFQEAAVVPDYHYVQENGYGGLVGARVLYLRKRDFWPKFEEWMANQI